jgi:hypothetical protein
MNDPYPIPFEWADNYEMPIPIIMGLIPHDCEQGFYPLIDGGSIECQICSM